MSMTKREYRPGTRAARFLQIRDAIMPLVPRMHEIRYSKSLTLGPFLIHFSVPGQHGPGSGYNINIWPDGVPIGHGRVLHGHKVVNVYWNQWDELRILSFRGGEWETDLLQMLKAAGNVFCLPTR